MTPDGLLYSMLSLRRNGGPTPWEACAALLDVADAGDVVAVTPAGSYLDRRLRGRVPAYALFVHPPAGDGVAGRIPSEDGIPVVLANRNRDLHPVHTIRWPPMPPRPRLRLRELDSLYGDSHRVSLIVVDCPAGAAAVLQGARLVLGGHRPAVLVDLTTVPVDARIDTWQACADAVGDGYLWCDGWLLPCATPQRRHESVLHCANRIACAVPIERFDAAARPDRTMPKPVSGFSMLAWADWQDSVAGDAARRGGVTVAFDTDLPGANLHPAETDGNGTWWRWTGPEARSWFALPVPGTGRWMLRFQVINWGVVGKSADLRVHVAGQTMTPDGLDGATATVGPVSFRPDTIGSVAKVQLVTPPTRLASPHDPRRIGMGIVHCLLEAA